VPGLAQLVLGRLVLGRLVLGRLVLGRLGQLPVLARGNPGVDPRFDPSPSLKIHLSRHPFPAAVVAGTTLIDRRDTRERNSRIARTTRQEIVSDHYLTHFWTDGQPPSTERAARRPPADIWI
jgi:hypothetical protein